MGLEVATWVNDLVPANPLASDSVSQGANHLEMIKQVLQNTFPGGSKAFRFPVTVAAQTSTITVAFPGDQNKLFPADATAGIRTVNLPDPTLGATVNEDGFAILVVKVDNSVNAVSIVPSGVQTINGAASLLLLRQYEFAYIVWDHADAKWYANIGRTRNVATNPQTANYTVLATDEGKTIDCDVTGGAFTVTLPSTLWAGFKVFVRRITANSATLLTLSAAANINGAATLTTKNQFDLFICEWTGSTWRAGLVLFPQAAPSTPTVQRLTSGTSATYTTPAGVVFLKVRMCAGGGGGGAQNTNNGNNGTDTSFGGWTAIHGVGGTAGGGAPGTGGTGGVNGTGTLINRVNGGAGQGGSGIGSATVNVNQAGGSGGTNPFAGAGTVQFNAAGGAAAPNSGAGGGGGGMAGNNANAGSGGGAGEYVEFYITAPAATYTYTVGTKGTGGAAGGNAGGNGADGIIIVEEFYAS